MKKLLHIIAASRGKESRTLKVSQAFIDAFKAEHKDWTIEELDISKTVLPELTPARVDGKYILLGGGELSGKTKEAWEEIVAQIDTFKSADGYLISTPMWNFGIPYFLKHYIDVILQPKYLFRYTENGVEGLIKNRKMVVITSRGGDYSPGTPAAGFDQQEPYLRTAFGFAGISDIIFINAQPMDALGPQTGQERLEKAREKARTAAAVF